MAAGVYNRALNNVTITDLRVLLVKGYTADRDHATVAAILASAGCDECDFDNYARKALADEAWTVTDATDTGKLDATDPTIWAAAGGTTDNLVSHAIVYEHVGADDASNLPVSYHTVGKNTNGGDLDIDIGAAGIFTTT